MDLAMTLLGFTFSGREALIIGLVILVILGVIVWAVRRPSRR
jgi:hypothetical protein